MQILSKSSVILNSRLQQAMDEEVIVQVFLDNGVSLIGIVENFDKDMLVIRKVRSGSLQPYVYENTNDLYSSQISELFGLVHINLHHISSFAFVTDEQAFKVLSRFTDSTNNNGN